MSQTTFFYRAIFRTEEQVAPPGGLICSELTNGPPRTVLWDRTRREWVFNREVGAMFLYDPETQDRAMLVSRDEAERIAREQLRTELPSEEELHQICEEGEAILAQGTSPEQTG